MFDSGKKPVIGILGAIGSGKSTVASEFERLGCGVIYADKIAHELLEQKDVKSKVISFFGRSILGTDGKIDRNKLAEIVFGDREKINLLNSIIHPLVLGRVEELLGRYNNKKIKAVVLDIPLLMEVGWDKMCDKLVFVDCKAEKRLERMQKSGLSDEKNVKIRENFQISLDNKRTIADNIIDNNSGFEALAKQVADILSDVVNNG